MNPSSVSGAIFYGIASGILTSALLLVVSKLFTHILLPWYQNVVYRGVRVDGEWDVHSEAMGQRIRIIVQQAAHKITGTATFVSSDKEENGHYEGIRSFNVVGSLKDRFMELSFRHTNPGRLGACSLLLEIVGDGRRMEGIMSFYSVTDDKVDCAKVQVRRPEAVPKKAEGQDKPAQPSSGKKEPKKPSFEGSAAPERAAGPGLNKPVPSKD